MRNECDILESFVRHHCALVDRMIIIDHRSADNSREILRTLRDEGLPIEVRTDESLIHRQGEALNALLRELMEHDPPDWILPLDADECLVVPKNADLRSILAACPEDMVQLLPWRTYVPLPSDDPSLPPYRRITHHRTSEHPQWYKILIPRSLAANPAHRISFGNHSLLRESGDACASVVSEQLSLAHFPVRDAVQIANKIVGGWLSHLADSTRPEQCGYQWKALYDEIKSHRMPSREDLKRMAVEYATSAQHDPESQSDGANDIVSDPISAMFDTLYAHSPADTWQLTLSAAQELAAEHARLSRLP